MLISRRYLTLRNGHWMAIPALVAAMAGSQFFAMAEDQLIARRPRRVMAPNPYAPQYCPPPVPVCPPTPVEPQPMTPSPTTPQPSQTTPNTTPTPSQDTPNTQNTDPNDLRNQLPAQQQNQNPAQNFPQADQSLASAADAQSAAPNIIGDFFGSTGGTILFSQNIANAVGSFGVGSQVSTFSANIGGQPALFGFANGNQITIQNTNQLIGTSTQPLVQLDPYTLQPIPGTGTFFVQLVNGQAVIQQQQAGVASVPAINTGTIRLAEGTSPIPRDRVFFNYSYFNNVPIAQGNVAVNRYTFGVEKTFFNGMTSLELRAPFATTLSSNRYFAGNSDLTNRNDVEMADLLLTGKVLLWQNEQFAFSSGVSFQGPTSDDTGVFSRDFNGNFVRIAQIDHNSFHVLPFVGAVWTPSDNWFTQSLLQIDQPFVGDTVRVNTNGQLGSPLVDAGRLNQQTFLYWTLSSGYWLWRSETTDDWGMSGLAPIAELHFNSSLNKEDSVTASNGLLSFGGNGGTTQVVNATIGAVAQLGWNKSLYMGYCTPIGGGQDRQFHGEFRAIFNWRFGAQQFRNVPVFQ